MIVERALADADFGRDGVDFHARDCHTESRLGISAAARRRADRALRLRAIMMIGALF